MTNGSNKSPFIRFDGMDAALAASLARSNLEEALDSLASAADLVMQQKQLRGRAIYMPDLDRWVQETGKRIAAEESLQFSSGDRALIVASELCFTGGHTRVIADICRVLDPKPIVILTDFFGRYAAGHNQWEVSAWLFPGVHVSMLPPSGPLTKVRNLLRAFAAIRPNAIYLFAHHQDVVPYAAATEAVDLPQWFFHHGDHHPAVGATVRHYRHLDFTREAQKLCGQFAGAEARLFPLSVEDRGVKTFAYPLTGVSTVTSGYFTKYATDGPLAYHGWIAALLSSGVVTHFHVGEIPDAYLDMIRRHLMQQAIDPARFRYMAHVPSLWETLLGIDAQIYVTSVPVGGGRTAAEALGAGYPIAYFTGSDARFLQVRSLYPAQCVSFDSIAGLLAAVQRLAADHQRVSAACRRFYLDHFSDENLRTALAEGGIA